MKRVLVTRPMPSSVLLAEALRKMGWEPFVEPLLSIHPTKEPAPDFAPDAVMLTSQSALAVFDGKRNGIESFSDITCYCVGENTAQTAAEYGFSRLIAGDGNGADLARLLSRKQDSGAKILHLCEERCDSQAARLLKDWGFDLCSWPTYRVETAEAFSFALKESLTQKKLDSALFYSPRTASVFADLAYGMGLDLKWLRAIAISQATAERLSALSLKEVIVAQKPSSDGMLHCLEEA
jgi:uroporphyrinogen-III synthase